MDAPAQKNPAHINSLIPENHTSETQNNPEQENNIETPVSEPAIETIQGIAQSDDDNNDDNTVVDQGTAAHVVDLRSESIQEVESTLQNVSPDADESTKDADKKEAEFIHSIVEEHAEH